MERGQPSCDDAADAAVVDFGRHMRQLEDKVQDMDIYVSQMDSPLLAVKPWEGMSLL